METTSNLDPLVTKVLQRVRNIEPRGYRESVQTIKVTQKISFKLCSVPRYVENQR